MDKRTVVRVGDVFCAELGDFKRFFQYIEKDCTGLTSHVIRVFKKLYPMDYSPVTDEIVKDDVDFYAHTIINPGVENNAWYKVGKSSELGLDALKTDVLFGTTAYVHDSNHKRAEADPFNNWTVWRVNEPYMFVGKLPEKYIGITEIGGVFPFVDICNRMKYGYYRYTFPVYYNVLRRVPLPDVDSFTKIEDEVLKTVTYNHFHGDRAVRQIVVTPAGKIRLTEQEPKSGKYRLFNGRFGDINWKHKQYITQDDFEAEWNATCAHTEPECARRKTFWQSLRDKICGKDE